MKIRIITLAKMIYDITVDSTDFETVVNKILEKKYLKLNNNVILMTSSIAEFHRI